MIKNIIAVYLIGLSVTSLASVLFIVLPYDNSVIAQQQNSTNSSEHNNSTGNSRTVTISQTLDRQQQQNPYSMSMGLQNQDWTGSTSLFNPILDPIKSKIHTTLNEATTNAINAIGGEGSNSTALAAFIHPENGFLVYDVLVLDSSNNIHRVIVDSGNGKVISNLPLSMTDMKSIMDPFTKMLMEGSSLIDLQLNLSDNIVLLNQNISICLFVCQPDTYTGLEVITP